MAAVISAARTVCTKHVSYLLVFLNILVTPTTYTQLDVTFLGELMPLSLVGQNSIQMKPKVREKVSWPNTHCGIHEFFVLYQRA